MSFMSQRGQTVKQGQKLITLAPTRNEADVDALDAGILSHQIDIARMKAELAGRKRRPHYPIVASRAHLALISQSRALIAERRERLASSLQTQRHMIEGRKREGEEIKARMKQTRRSIKLLNEQVGISKRLLRSQLSNRMEHLKLLREQSNLQSRLNEDKAGLAQREAAVAEAQSRLSLVRSEFSRTNPTGV